MRIAYALFAVAVALTAAAAQPVDPMLRGVRRLIDDGRAGEALAVLEKADLSGVATRDRARISFYQARAYEELGEEQKAIAAYTHATELAPDYGAALNNLAQLLARRGQYARAAALLKTACALDDPRRTLYLNNYAAAAEKGGDLAAAREAYAMVAAAQPDNVEAQLRAIRLLDDPLRMAEMLLKLSKRGESGAAQSLALDLLRKPYAAPAKRALLSVVAGTFVGQRTSAAEAASRLAPLRDDPLVGDGVSELLLLHAGNVDAAQYRWWRSPRDERFAALVRDLGARRVGANEKEKAEGYFKLALDYSEGTDPDAFVELADLYYGQRRIADLDALARQYERPMLEAKTSTIVSHDYAAEYRFHMALGTMYAYMERWGSEGNATSAIFQLTQAQRAAADYNRTPAHGTKIPTDPKTIELLATGYAKTNRPDRAVAVRIEHADAFLAEGRKTAATMLLKPLDGNAIADPVYRERYTDVTKRLAMPIESDYLLGFPESVDVSLKSAEPTSVTLPRDLGKQIMNALANYVLADSDATRERAETTLRKLGVSELNPTTMSRTSGDLMVQIEGKAVRYRYVVKGGSR